MACEVEMREEEVVVVVVVGEEEEEEKKEGILSDWNTLRTPSREGRRPAKAVQGENVPAAAVSKKKR